ncbi:hypothetical protein ACLOJK_019946 [Asimina triloba]
MKLKASRAEHLQVASPKGGDALSLGSISANTRALIMEEYLRSDVHRRHEEFKHSHHSQSGCVKALSDGSGSYCVKFVQESLGLAGFHCVGFAHGSTGLARSCRFGFAKGSLRSTGSRCVGFIQWSLELPRSCCVRFAQESGVDILGSEARVALGHCEGGMHLASRGAKVKKLLTLLERSLSNHQLG